MAHDGTSIPHNVRLLPFRGRGFDSASAETNPSDLFPSEGPPVDARPAPVPTDALEEFPSEEPGKNDPCQPPPGAETRKSGRWWPFAIAIVDTLIPVGLVLLAVYLAFS